MLYTPYSGHESLRNVIFVYEMRAFDPNKKKSRHFNKMNEFEIKMKKKTRKMYDLNLIFEIDVNETI